MSSIASGISAAGSALGPQDDRPLSEQEFQLLQRLLSDPFSFPLQFKTWLVSYLSSSDLSIPMGSVLGLTHLLGITSAGSGTLGILPAGIILPYGGTTAPLGSLMCDGQSYLKSEQQRLFDAIGTFYGSVDALHFNTPDLRGRGLFFLGPHPLVNALGKTEGQADPTKRSPRHATSQALTATQTAHFHSTAFTGAYGGVGTTGFPGATYSLMAWADAGGASPPALHEDLTKLTDAKSPAITIGGTVGSTDPNDGHTDMAAFVVANAIIIN